MYKYLNCNGVESFSSCNVPRTYGRGGGILIIYIFNVNIEFHREKVKSFQGVQHNWKFSEECVDILVIYRPPPKQKEELSNDLYVKEFGDLGVDTHISTNDYNG